MIICSSNAWGGSMPSYVQYILDVSRTVDVYCMQEVHMAHNHLVPEQLMPKDPGSRTVPLNPHLFNQLRTALNREFYCVFSTQMVGHLHDLEATEHWVSYGNAMFVRRSCEVIVQSDTLVYKQSLPHNCGETAAWKSAQACVIQHAEERVLISHTHGAWWNSDKGDVPHRHEQFANWSNYLDRLSNNYNVDSVLLCGDFNQTSDTKLIRSIPHWKVFGSNPGHNLLERAGIKDTRTVLYNKPIREADYMFSSPSLRVKLTVDYQPVSDHATLFGELHAT